MASVDDLTAKFNILLRAILLEFLTPIGWVNILCVLAMVWIVQARHVNMLEELREMQLWGPGLSPAFVQGALLHERWLSTALTLIIFVAIGTSFAVTFRAYHKRPKE